VLQLRGASSAAGPSTSTSTSTRRRPGRHVVVHASSTASAPTLALAASASQPLKSGIRSLYLSVPVPLLIPFVVTSRPTTASRPSNPLNRSPLAPQIRLLLTTVRIYKLYLLTYAANVDTYPTPMVIHDTAGRSDLDP